MSLGPNCLMPGRVIVYDDDVGLFSCIILFEAIPLGINCAISILLQSFPTINSGGSRVCLGSQTVCQICSIMGLTSPTDHIMVMIGKTCCKILSKLDDFVVLAANAICDVAMVMNPNL